MVTSDLNVSEGIDDWEVLYDTKMGTRTLHFISTELPLEKSGTFYGKKCDGLVSECPVLWSNEQTRNEIIIVRKIVLQMVVYMNSTLAISGSAYMCYALTHFPVV